MKYQIPYDQNERLPNKLGITNHEELAIIEFEGFLRAELILTAELTSETRFDKRYLKKIHGLALGNIYDFAGKWRSVNLSKGGFFFASAQFLSETMDQFECDFLLNCNFGAISEKDFVRQAAKMHAELLFVHPFREGNGRTARIFINLLFRKHGYNPPDWSNIHAERYDIYISGVQQAAMRCYDIMTILFFQLVSVPE